VVSRGRVYEADRLPGFVACTGTVRLGLLTYHIENGECEVVTLDSLRMREGIGSTLMEAVMDLARSEKCRRIWLITTNDNTPAIRFYLKLGFTPAAIHRNAIKESRKLKPEIPETGFDGIPIRDEIEMELSI
jgi:ribosomal protein S18 acetylase RimI-like enzyme